MDVSYLDSSLCYNKAHSEFQVKITSYGYLESEDNAQNLNMTKATVVHPSSEEKKKGEGKGESVPQGSSGVVALSRLC